jgi:hypothetical protein
MSSNFKIKNVHVGQTPLIKEHFKKIINNFDRVIEIGSDRGGLALFLHLNNNNCEIISYEIHKERIDVPKTYNIDFRIENCFNEPTKNEIISLIKDEKRVLLLCDGGNKELEFNTFSKYLKINDVIMCHDFEETNEDFNNIKNKLKWAHPSETKLSNIQKSILENNLQPYYYNEFKSVLWGSFKKQ